jgi:adenylylsulfate kinase-like enzyme
MVISSLQRELNLSQEDRCHKNREISTLCKRSEGTVIGMAQYVSRFTKPDQEVRRLELDRRRTESQQDLTKIHQDLAAELMAPLC